jgi:hypothetical protein
MHKSWVKKVDKSVHKPAFECAKYVHFFNINYLRSEVKRPYIYISSFAQIDTRSGLQKGWPKHQTIQAAE